MPAGDDTDVGSGDEEEDTSGQNNVKVKVKDAQGHKLWSCEEYFFACLLTAVHSCKHLSNDINKTDTLLYN